MQKDPKVHILLRQEPTVKAHNPRRGRILGYDFMAATPIDRLLRHCHVVKILGSCDGMSHHAELSKALPILGTFSSGHDTRRQFSGSRTLSETVERHAQEDIAASFWLIAPYITAPSVANPLSRHLADGTRIGMVLTAVALLEVPVLGYSMRRFRVRLGSS